MKSEEWIHVVLPSAGLIYSVSNIPRSKHWFPDALNVKHNLNNECCIMWDN